MKHRVPPLVPMSRTEFYRHLAQYIAFALALLLTFLGVGVLGYRHFVGLSWIDSLLSASMILGGMGPVAPTPTDAGKVFASLFALFSGAAYPALTALALYPLVHRAMRRLHLQALAAASDESDDSAP